MACERRDLRDHAARPNGIPIAVGCGCLLAWFRPIAAIRRAQLSRRTTSRAARATRTTTGRRRSGVAATPPALLLDGRRCVRLLPKGKRARRARTLLDFASAGGKRELDREELGLGVSATPVCSARAPGRNFWRPGCRRGPDPARAGVRPACESGEALIRSRWLSHASAARTRRRDRHSVWLSTRLSSYDFSRCGDRGSTSSRRSLQPPTCRRPW